MGRPAIGDQAMTPAQRKARSRANALGELRGQLEIIERNVRVAERVLADAEKRGGQVSVQFVREVHMDIGQAVFLALAALPNS